MGILSEGGVHIMCLSGYDIIMMESSRVGY